jgi:plasmid rolling circle replication initiator protein Rep
LNDPLSLTQEVVVFEGGEELLFEFLSDISSKDAIWDERKAQLDRVSQMYRVAGFLKRAARTQDCSGFLVFVWLHNVVTGEMRLKLRRASFCRCRGCTLCQWRKTLYWLSQYLQVLPELCLRYPTSKFLFATLTVPNCLVSELRSTIVAMNKGWERFIKRKEMSHFHGWIRTTEVTKGKNGPLMAHPHFHILILAKPGYFGGNYVKRDRWLVLWQESMRDFSITQVDVRTAHDLMKVTKKARKSGLVAQEGAVGDARALHEVEMPLDVNQLHRAGQRVGVEVLKYAVKPVDLLGKGVNDPESVEWFKYYTEQVHKLRFVATGGVFKKLFSKEPDSEAMVYVGEGLLPDEGEVEGSTMHFSWDRPIKKYRRVKGVT